MITMAEIKAKARAKAIAKAGGEDKWKKSLADTRAKIAAHKYVEPTDKEKSNYQNRIGRAYNE